MWARQVFADSEQGIKEAEARCAALAGNKRNKQAIQLAREEAERHGKAKEAAREILIECGQQVFDAGTPVCADLTHPETGTTGEVAGVIRKNGTQRALVKLDGETLAVSVAYSHIRARETEG